MSRRGAYSAQPAVPTIWNRGVRLLPDSRAPRGQSLGEYSGSNSVTIALKHFFAVLFIGFTITSQTNSSINFSLRIHIERLEFATQAPRTLSSPSPTARQVSETDALLVPRRPGFGEQSSSFQIQLEVFKLLWLFASRPVHGGIGKGFARARLLLA